MNFLLASFLRGVSILMMLAAAATVGYLVRHYKAVWYPYWEKMVSFFKSSSKKSASESSEFVKKIPPSPSLQFPSLLCTALNEAGVKKNKDDARKTANQLIAEKKFSKKVSIQIHSAGSNDLAIMGYLEQSKGTPLHYEVRFNEKSGLWVETKKTDF